MLNGTPRPVILLLALAFGQRLLAQGLPAYCIPITTDSTALGDRIDGIELAGLATANTSETAAYTDMRYGGPSRIAVVAPGDTALLTITSGTRAGAVFAAWIDLDVDGQFGPDELCGTWTSTTSNDIGTIPVVIPALVREGYTALRVRCAYQQPVIDPCATYTHGETEDHTVLITGGDPCIPLIDYGNVAGDQITGVQLSVLSVLNTVDDPSPYLDRRDQGAILNIGVTYNLTVTTGPALGDLVGAWVDWSGDGDWDDPGELLGQAYANNAFQQVLFTFAVPASTVQGQKVLRVRAWDSGLPGDGCAERSFGETEDYTVGVRYPGFLCFPVAGSTWGGDEIVASVLQGDTFRTAPRWPFHAVIDTVATRFTLGATDVVKVLSGEHASTRYQLWIDANRDGDFNDAGETLASALSNAPGQWLSLPFTVPAGMAPGITHLRIRCSDGSLAAPGSCANSRTGEIEDHVVVVVDPAGPCIPFLGRWTQGGAFIDGVELGGINNLGSGGLRGPAYTDHPLLSTILSADSTYDLVLTPGSDSALFFDAFADLDLDGDLQDANEHLGRVAANGAGQPVTLTFTLPSAVLPGVARFRVRASNADSVITACQDLEHGGTGETEDYRVDLTTTTGLRALAPQRMRAVPQPHDGTIRVDLPFNVTSGRIELRDALGRLLAHTPITGPTAILQAQGLATGTYLLSAIMPNGRDSAKVHWP
ncbi:MAG: T9SS type A sorting domain-containing protein [Flavobacteriales bacterium]|nr:T9SS type A sorting domain-containing protein [Flavobacteriales bacterium]